MLALERKKGESVYLFTTDGCIKIQVARIKPSKVRLAFDAPPTVTIKRQELLIREATWEDLEKAFSTEAAEPERTP